MVIPNILQRCKIDLSHANITDQQTILLHVLRSLDDESLTDIAL